MLMNYHIGRLVLSSLCVESLVRLVLGGVRFAGCSTTRHYIHVPPSFIVQLNSRHKFIRSPFFSYAVLLRIICI